MYKAAFGLVALLALAGPAQAAKNGAVDTSPAQDLEGGFLDRVDPSGDRAFIWPHPADSNSGALPDEKALVSFSCTTRITGKRPNGQLTIGFHAVSPENASVQFQFEALASECNYAFEAQIKEGRLNDGFLGVTYVYRCRRSPHSIFAVSCGPYLGSTLHVLAQGNGWGRTVQFRFPSTMGPMGSSASKCQLPFMIYGEDGLAREFNDGMLTFDYVECRSDVDKPAGSSPGSKAAGP